MVVLCLLMQWKGMVITMTKTAVLVSGGGANLQSILDLYYFGEIPELELAAVISSNPDAYALERARNAGVPAYVVERGVFPNNASFCNALLGKLKDLDIELVVCAGFAERLSYSILHYYQNRVINVQPALFPAFCGPEGFDPMGALERTLGSGVRITGATAYFMTEDDIGCGPIILQKAIEVQQNDTIATLSERIMRECEWKLLPEAVRLFCAGRLRVKGSRVLITEA